MEDFLNLITTQGTAIFGSLWPLVWALVRIVIIVLPMFACVAYLTLWERKLIGWMHIRLGPNRVGPLGLLQPIADALKLLMKEIIAPAQASKVLYFIAPIMVIMPAFAAWAVIPFQAKMVLADVNAGLLYIMAISSIGVYGVILAGWSSNSKYPFLGSVRASAQMISYELSLGLSIIPVLMVFGELNLSKISIFQDANGWLLLPLWGEGLSVARWVLWVPLLISFCIFVVSMFAETNRLPFDMAECETELVAGYHTEYSSMKFALFFMGEYAAMIVGSGLAVTLVLGGWSIPFGPLIGLGYEAGATPLWLGFLHIAVFLAKIVAFILFFILIRWTLPRIRFDQLMKLGWMVMFELALANVILTAALMIWFPLK